MAGFPGLSADELQLFLEETEEHLDHLESGLLQIERGGAGGETIALIFRAAHTIKGAAATVGLDGMARLTHIMETLFDQMRSGNLSPSAAVLTLLLRAVDVLRRMLEAVGRGHDPGDPPPALLAQLHAAENSDERLSGSPAPSTPTLSDLSDYTAVDLRLDPACEMPAVRALQVLLALEALGSVLASEPPLAAIETEQMGNTLKVWLDGHISSELILKAVSPIPDIIKADIDTKSSQLPPAGLSNSPAEIDDSSEAPSGAKPPTAVEAGGKERSVRVDVNLLDELMNLVGELVVDRGRITDIASGLARRQGCADVADDLNSAAAHLTRITASLQETVLKARMLPVERVFRKFPRMVRDLAEHMGKQVDFQIAGEATEIDRSVLEVIGDPLMHLLRNALDHGLENSDERRAAGKPAMATLRLSAAYEQNLVVIRVEDDGRGIEPEYIKARALENGTLTPDTAAGLSEAEVLQLLFTPGFSTAGGVSDVSGRGVGLDVVRRNIERVGGRIEVDTKPGAGTVFRLVMPLTLATVRALLIQADHEVFALPISAIAETLRVAPEAVTSVKGRWVARVRDRVVPLLWLRQFIDPVFRPPRGNGPVLAVIAGLKGELIGLVVDRLLGEAEIVVKGLSNFFGSVQGIGGITILGDGALAPIIDFSGLAAVLAAENAQHLIDIRRDTAI